MVDDSNSYAMIPDLLACLSIKLLFIFLLQINISFYAAAAFNVIKRRQDE